MERDNKMMELEIELARQNEQWAEAMSQLEALADVSLEVPQQMLQELDEACTPRRTVSQHVVGIRA